MAKTKKKFNIKILFLAIVAAVLMVILGALFSAITGYKATEQKLLVQSLVWGIDIVLSHTLAWLIFTWGKRRIKYFNWIAWGLSVLFCVVLVVVITQTVDVAFVSLVVSSIVPIGGAILLLIKKNFYRVKIKEESKDENKKD